MNIIFEHPQQHASRPGPGSRTHVKLKRRFHSKSRMGCLPCKKRRTKCDELPGRCSACEYRGVRCEYPKRTPPPTIDDVPKLKEDAQGLPSSCNVEVELELPELIEELPDNPTATAALWNHFKATIDEIWLGSPVMQSIFQQNAAQLVRGAPFLLHAILSISASHLNHYTPCEEYDLAASTHYHNALIGYRSEVAAGGHLLRPDAAFAAGLLIVMLGFLHSIQDTPGPENDTEALLWVQALQGMRMLTDSDDFMSSLRAGTIWSPMIVIPALGTTGVAVSRGGLASSIWSLRGEFERKHGYSRPIPAYSDVAFADLQELMVGTPCTVNNIGHHIAFIAHLPQKIMCSVKDSNPYALLLLGVWCGSASRIDAWWIKGPARGEARRIQGLLSALGFSSLAQLVQRYESSFRKDSLPVIDTLSGL